MYFFFTEQSKKKETPNGENSDKKDGSNNSGFNEMKLSNSACRKFFIFNILILVIVFFKSY